MATPLRSAVEARAVAASAMPCSPIARAFLAWVAFLVATSWVGFGLAEAERFSATTALLAGAVAAVGTAALLARRGTSRMPGGLAVGLVAAGLTLTLIPPVDTTLLSQDASIHLASGRWLGRNGSLAMPDADLAALPADVRIGLFEMGAIGITRVSQSRLPGGLVLPDLQETVTYPSFAHLLMVWIAIADRIAGSAGVALLGPLFAATAWWAIGLTALLAGDALSAIATVALLAALLPEHWFARFLMPEILAQALVWCGMAAAQMALAAESAERAARAAAGTDGSPARSRRDGGALVAGVLAGASLGISGFARLEQLAIFVPCLLLARGLVSTDRRVLPRGAFVPFVLAAGHALAHLAIIPTDYGKRIGRVLVDVIAFTWVALGSTTRRVALSLAVLAVVTAAVAVVLRVRRRGLVKRVFGGIAGALLFASIFGGRIPEELPAVTWLGWYVPWPAWLAAAIGVLPPVAPSGLGLALFLEACDQIASPRVTNEQIWAARRLVTVVLPLLALAAGWAIARRDRPRPRAIRALGLALVLVAIAIGARSIAPLAGRPVQAGGASLARDIGAALPPRAKLVVAKPLDWLHLAPELWLAHGQEVILARDAQLFPAALGWFLGDDPSREVFALSGAVVPTGRGVDARALLPELPVGWSAREVRSFRWPFRSLERTTDRPPAQLIDQEAVVTLFRLERPGTAVMATP